jgi:hypothetical protein
MPTWSQETNTPEEPTANWPELAEAARRPLLLLAATAVFVLCLGLLASEPRDSAGCYVDTDTGQITDYRLVAFPLTLIWGTVLFATAWIWASERQARQGQPKRPGTMGLGLLVSYWGLLVTAALASNSIHTGGPFDFEVVGLLALPAVLVVPVALLIQAATIVMGRFQGGSTWRSKAERASVFFAWSMLVLGFPLVLGAVGAAGYGCD